jgi:hypothetical protein
VCACVCVVCCVLCLCVVFLHVRVLVSIVSEDGVYHAQPYIPQYTVHVPIPQYITQYITQYPLTQVEYTAAVKSTTSTHLIHHICFSFNLSKPQELCASVSR